MDNMSFIKRQVQEWKPIEYCDEFLNGQIVAGRLNLLPYHDFGNLFRHQTQP